MQYSKTSRTSSKENVGVYKPPSRDSITKAARNESEAKPRALTPPGNDFYNSDFSDNLLERPKIIFKGGAGNYNGRQEKQSFLNNANKYRAPYALPER